MKMRKRERVFSCLSAGARCPPIPIPRRRGASVLLQRAFDHNVVLFSVAQQVWFKNRRAKWRRQKRSSSEESENAEKWNKTSSKASPEKREEEGKSDLDSDS